MKYDIKKISLAKEGKDRIEWAGNQMSVLRLIRERFKKESPLKGATLACCLHVTSETANLMIALKSGGAKVILCASNPLSTNDSVAASLVKYYGVPTFAIKGEDNAPYYKHLHAVLDEKPNLTMDDGADLVSLIHQKRKELLGSVVGSTEETTTGVIRLRAMEKHGSLKIPVLAVNENLTKHLIDEAHIKKAKDGVILAQAGHFDVEINIPSLKKLAEKVRTARPMVEEYVIGKKRVYLLAGGRLVNLAAAEGHPASVMDMSFAGQALSAEWMWEKRGTLEPKVYELPANLDVKIAELKLQSEGINIDKLTKTQKDYLSSWEEGT